MPSNPELDERVLREFAQRRARQKVATVPFVAIMIVALVLYALDRLGISQGPKPLLGWTLFVGLMLLGLFAFWNWRCPACGGYLGKKLDPTRCGHCEVVLRRWW